MEMIGEVGPPQFGGLICAAPARRMIPSVATSHLRARPFTPLAPIHRHLSLPQSSSASRFTAGADGFLNLSQSFERPLR
jgi:hypothetical protein